MAQNSDVLRQAILAVDGPKGLAPTQAADWLKQNVNAENRSVIASILGVEDGKNFARRISQQIDALSQSGLDDMAMTGPSTADINQLIAEQLAEQERLQALKLGMGPLAPLLGAKVVRDVATPMADAERAGGMAAGAVTAPFDAAGRMLTPGYDYENVDQASKDALDAASLAVTGGAAATATGMYPKGSIGQMGSGGGGWFSNLFRMGDPKQSVRRAIERQVNDELRTIAQMARNGSIGPEEAAHRMATVRQQHANAVAAYSEPVMPQAPMQPSTAQQIPTPQSQGSGALSGGANTPHALAGNAAPAQPPVPPQAQTFQPPQGAPSPSPQPAGPPIGSKQTQTGSSVSPVRYTTKHSQIAQDFIDRAARGDPNIRVNAADPDSIVTALQNEFTNAGLPVPSANVLKSRLKGTFEILADLNSRGQALDPAMSRLAFGRGGKTLATAPPPMEMFGGQGLSPNQIPVNEDGSIDVEALSELLMMGSPSPSQTPSIPQQGPIDPRAAAAMLMAH